MGDGFTYSIANYGVPVRFMCGQMKENPELAEITYVSKEKQGISFRKSLVKVCT